MNQCCGQFTCFGVQRISAVQSFDWQAFPVTSAFALRGYRGGAGCLCEDSTAQDVGQKIGHNSDRLRC